MSIKENNYGRTMLETIMYLGILMCITMTLFSYVNQMTLRYKIGRTAQQLMDLKKAIVHYTAADESYSQIAPEAMSKAQAIPLDMRSGSDSTFRHALGGTAEFGPLTRILGNEKNYNYMFFIRFNGIPHAACTELLTQGHFYSDGSDLDSVIINGKYMWRFEHSFYPTDNIAHVQTKMPTSNTEAGAATMHLTLSETAAACYEKTNNTILWIFS